MLIKCPKCGFDQPKDTYCANCGIEIDSFKPIIAPLWIRAFRSPLFSLIIFISFGYGAFFYLKSSNRLDAFKITSSTENLYTNSTKPIDRRQPTQSEMNKKGDEKLNNQKPLEKPIATSNPRISADKEPNQIPEKINSLDLDTTQANEESKNSAIKTVSLNAGTNSDSIDETTKFQINETVKGPLDLDIRFVEVPMSLIQRFHEEATDQNLGDSGEMNFAIVKNAAKWTSHHSNIELDRFTKKVPGLKKKLQWFNGTEDPMSRTPIGLNFQVSILERDGGHLNCEIVITRTLVEHIEGVQSPLRKEFTAHFEADVGSVIGLSGLMPHTEIKTNDKEWLQNSLLKVFLSPSYLKGETELLILLQFKSDSK